MDAQPPDLLQHIANKLDAHIESTTAYRVSEESDRRAIKRDIRCLHDGYHENKKVVDDCIADIKGKVDDINLALFAKDEDNKFEQRGLMTTARNVDKHITVMCSLAQWGWKLILGALGLLGALKAAGML